MTTFFSSVDFRDFVAGGGVLCLVGPTASGKSALACEVARMHGGEVICADAMTVYRHMNIGTAKPTKALQLEIPHHLLDCVDPWDDYDVAHFFHDAKKIVELCLDKGVLPILCGGSHYYIYTLLQGLAPIPEVPARLRAKWVALLQQRGETWLWNRLNEVDPLTAGRLHPRDAKRVIRALEVFEATGQQLSAYKPQGGLAAAYPIKKIAVHREPEELKQRVKQRVAQMFQEGLLEEVRFLQKQEKGLSRTAREAVGYKECLDFLETGGKDEEGLKDLIVVHTMQLVKKQMTWLKRDKDIEWIDIPAFK